MRKTNEMHEGLQICMVHDKISPFSKKVENENFESAGDETDKKTHLSRRFAQCSWNAGNENHCQLAQNKVTTNHVTTANYIDHIRHAFLFHAVKRFDVRGNKK